jgi:hypothetical protein
MEKEQNNPTYPADKPKGDLPGTSKDPTGRVISDKSPPGKSRQDQGSERSGSGSRDPNSGAQKGA